MKSRWAITGTIAKFLLYPKGGTTSAYSHAPCRNDATSSHRLHTKLMNDLRSLRSFLRQSYNFNYLETILWNNDYTKKHWLHDAHQLLLLFKINMSTFFNSSKLYISIKYWFNQWFNIMWAMICWQNVFHRSYYTAVYILETKVNQALSSGLQVCMSVLFESLCF